MSAWTPIADRGKFSLTMRTRARAIADGLAIHPEAVLVGTLFTDSGNSVTMAFTSHESLQVFLDEMQPRAIIWVPEEAGVQLSTLH
jgi:hypothetical protein